MSYRIKYTEKPGNNPFRLPFLTLFCFLFFLLLVRGFWPEGYGLIQDMIFSARNSASVSALEHLSEAIGRGENTAEAFSAFFHRLVP